MNLSLIYLNLKKYSDGWSFYEKRLENEKWQNSFIIENKKPILHSFDFEGKKILVISEQGIGDQIMYLSLLNEIDSTRNEIIVALDNRLIDLFKRTFRHIGFIGFDVSINSLNYDYYLPSCSLGKFFRNSGDSFKNQKVAYLKSDESKTKNLKNKLTANGNKLCGVSWKSKNPEFGEHKSMALTEYLPILNLDKINFVNLQYGDTQEEIKNLKFQYNVSIEEIDGIDLFNDIDDLVALVDACDFILTSSNVTAHIAGALGKETYLLVPYAKGKIWYWHDGDKKSLWYPSVQQYFQSENGSWDNAIPEIKDEIQRKYL
jgi:hypothetical protein